MISHRHTQRGPDTGFAIAPGALKLTEACDYLGGISKVTIRRLIARGLIKSNRSLRHTLIAVAELDRFIESGGSQ
jgi:excisionase family DNA binding protein